MCLSLKLYTRVKVKTREKDYKTMARVEKLLFDNMRGAVMLICLLKSILGVFFERLSGAKREVGQNPHRNENHS